MSVDLFEILINQLLMGFKILHVLEPAINLFPIIEKPMRFINNKEKVLYTAITLFIYLVCCQIPIYGVLRS
jgi:protein transport protein SEC61 subunit alpha